MLETSRPVRRHRGARRRRLAGVVAEPVAGEEDLADDLLGGEVAHELLRAGVAEAAGERAADLARQAERAAAFLGDVDGLDLDRPSGAARRKAQEPFPGAVFRDLLGDDLRPRQCEGAGERGRGAPSRHWSSRRNPSRRAHRASARAGRPACRPGARARRIRRAPRQAARATCPTNDGFSPASARAATARPLSRLSSMTSI